jgi:DNA-binding transcriptional regulator YhcF (GntR family)
VSGALDLSVDRTSDVPLGTQLIWKLRMFVAAGALAPGAKLPGIREVAKAAGVNVNTVRSVFARLEDEGLLVSEQGRGTFVAEDARLDANLWRAAETTIARALAAGINPRELAAALYASSTRPEERDERGSLYRQIRQLEREVARLDPLTPLDQHPSRSAQPRVLTLAELRDTRDNLVARVDQLHRERQAWRAEAQQLRDAELQAAEHERAERRMPRPWRAGVWTGRAGTAVSWTTP